MPWHPQILADQLTLSQPGGTDYAHLITTGTPGFSDLPTALIINEQTVKSKQTKVNIDQDTLTVHVVHRVPTAGPSEGLKIRGCQ